MRRAIFALALTVVSCAKARVATDQVDAADLDASTSDASDPSDAPVDAAATDVDAAGDIDAAIDAMVGMIDAAPTMIDAAPTMIDAAPTMIDARPIDASPPDASPPDASTCPVLPCTLDPQCGCPLDEACDVTTSTTPNACRAITSPGHETNPCTTGTDCDKGYVCVGDGTNDNCHKYCQSNNDCGSPRGQCVIQITDSNNAAIPGAVVCSSDCDPTGNAAAYCPSGWKCGVFDATYNGTDYTIADCEIAGTGGQGTSCKVTGSSPAAGDDTKCAADSMCIQTATSTFKCLRICTYPNGNECPTGTACQTLNPALTIGGTTYGVCD